ncbi:hypothetical protein PENSPDRAFT_656136 [Peniophora sp. CONT]|nr:hypothetical protein PENSPDRAFT_656136 [Peniophora sp. CONT]
MDSVISGKRRLCEQIKVDAARVTAQLRTAWGIVSAAMTADHEAVTFDDLASFEILVKDIYLAIESCQQNEEDKLSIEDWSRVYDAGLPDLLQDIVMEEHFFSLPSPLVIGYIFDTHMRISYPSDDWATLHGTRVLQRSNDLWAALWKNRERISRWPPNRPANNTGEHPVIQALMTHHLLHRFTKTPVSSSSHIHHYALYAWAKAEAPTADFTYVFFCETGLNGPSYSPTAFIREAIIDGAGVDVCFARLAAVLRGDAPWHWDHLDNLRSSLSLFGGLILHGDMPESTSLVVAAGQHRVPQLVVSIAKQHALAGGLRACPAFYNAAFSLIIKATQYDCVANWSGEHRDSLLVPGDDVLAISACAIDLLAMHGEESGMTKNARAALVSVVNFLYSVLRMYYDRVKSIKGNSNVPALQAELIAGLQRGAKNHWWPSLRRIEAAKRQCDARNENIVQYSALWKGFGALLGCDAKLERQREAREAAGRCTRPDCEYNKKPSKKQLLRCKGCGVFYCSRDCQVTDWKDGHKKVCRRLDAANGA